MFSSQLWAGILMGIKRVVLRCMGMVCVPVLVLIIMWVGTPLTAQTPSYDDIFKQVFGRLPEKQYFTQQMALVIDNDYVGDDLQVLVPSIGSDYQFFSYAILTYLKQVQKKGTLHDLTLKIDEKGMLSADAIREAGYGLTVDRRAFRVSISIPAAYRKQIVYYVMGEPEPQSGVSSGQLRMPAKWGGFINYSLSSSVLFSKPVVEEVESEALLEEEVAPTETDAQSAAPLGSFYGTTKTGSYALNYAGAFDFSSDNAINMSNLNIQKDFGEENKRWTFGQVMPETQGVQAGISLMGVGITAGPILNSIGNFSPEFSHALTLERDSKIDIYVNYKHIKTLELAGGEYDLKGFPLRTGFNMIKLVTTTLVPVEPPTKSMYVDDAIYNPIEDGVLYTTEALDDESLLDKSIRLHHRRRESSDWLMSDKVPRKGLLIEDDVFPTHNVVTTVDVIPFSVDPVLLDPKYFEWNYSVGYPMSWQGFSPVTQPEFTHSLYVKKGLNRFITATGYTQLNEAHALVGHEVYMSSPFGPIFFNNALKKTKGVARLGGYSKASFMTYPIYSDPNQWFKLMSLGVSGSLRTPRFIPFGVNRTTLNEQLLFQYAGSVSYQITHLFSGTLQYSQTKALMGNADVDIQQFIAIIQRKLPFGFGLSTSVQRSIGPEVVEPFLATFKLSWSGFDGVGVSVMNKQTVSTQDIQVDAVVQKDFLDGGIRTSSTAHHSLEKKSVGLSVAAGRHNGSVSMVDTDIQTDQQLGYSYGNQRFNSNVSVVSRTISGAPLQMMTLSGESSIVFADGHVAISTPIQESFAMFVADNSLKGRTVFVGDDGRKIDRLGPAVLPSIRDRVLTDVVIDVPSLSVGAQLDRLHTFSPVNFNAYLVELHVTPSVMLMGKLLKGKRPARYLRGTISSRTDPSVKEKLVTSRSGIFQVPNLKPGDYTISFGKKPYASVPITIPDDADGLYRLANIPLTTIESTRPKGPEKTALEEEINEKRDATVAIKGDSKMTLLKELMADILAEKESPPVLGDDSLLDSEPGASAPKQPPKPNTQPMPKTAQALHQLKQDVNDFIFNQPLSGPQIKDSIEIVKKINDYYLTTYRVEAERPLLINEQLRPTTQEAMLIHKQKKKQHNVNMMHRHQQVPTSSGMESAIKQHQQRIKGN